MEARFGCLCYHSQYFLMHQQYGQQLHLGLYTNQSNPIAKGQQTLVCLLVNFFNFLISITLHCVI